MPLRYDRVYGRRDEEVKQQRAGTGSEFQISLNSVDSMVTESTDPRILHARALKSLDADRSIFNNLITLYSKSNNGSFLFYAQRLFSQFQYPNVVSWTSLVSAHANSSASLSFFLSMLRCPAPVFPNQRTLASLFKTCATLSCLCFGLALHALSFKLSINSQPFSASAMVSFYSKLSFPGDARKVFDEISDRDEVCYSALVVGLAQNSRAIDALSVFLEMRRCNVGSTVHSISGALRATAEMAALEQCRVIHGHALVCGFTENVVVGSGLIDGYGKSGFVTDARKMFDDLLPGLNVVGWNAMMAAYAQQGDKDSVVDLWNAMRGKGLIPDEYSFLAMLTALANAGLFVESGIWIGKMRMEHGLDPTLEHYTCLVHAMARMGQLEEAERIAMTMPTEPDAAVWRALLSACANHGTPETALVIAKRLLELDQYDQSAYAIAANVLSNKGRWNEVAELRKLMKYRRVRRVGGMSWMEMKGKVHVFLAGDRRHDRTEEIYGMLDELMVEIEKVGYGLVLDEIIH